MIHRIHEFTPKMIGKIYGMMFFSRTCIGFFARLHLGIPLLNHTLRYLYSLTWDISWPCIDNTRLVLSLNAIIAQFIRLKIVLALHFLARIYQPDAVYPFPCLSANRIISLAWSKLRSCCSITRPARLCNQLKRILLLSSALSTLTIYITANTTNTLAACFCLYQRSPCYCVTNSGNALRGSSKYCALVYILRGW